MSAYPLTCKNVGRWWHTRPQTCYNGLDLCDVCHQAPHNVPPSNGGDMSRIVADFHQQENGDWRWRIRSAGNHETIAVSSEGYRNRADAEHALKLINPDAEIIEVNDPQSED